jgi:hypothetical protein
MNDITLNGIKYSRGVKRLLGEDYPYWEYLSQSESGDGYRSSRGVWMKADTDTHHILEEMWSENRHTR